MGLDPDRLFYEGVHYLDAQRAERLAAKSAALYLSAYETALGGASTATARHEASKVALVRTETRLALQVATENAESFTRARTEAHWGARILKLWDAYLDKRTCPVCDKLDGTLIPRGDKFKDPATRLVVRPGQVHPYCRCIEEYLTLSEARLMGLRTAKGYR